MPHARLRVCMQRSGMNPHGRALGSPVTLLLYPLLVTLACTAAHKNSMVPPFPAYLGVGVQRRHQHVCGIQQLHHTSCSCVALHICDQHSAAHTQGLIVLVHIIRLWGLLLCAVGTCCSCQGLQGPSQSHQDVCMQKQAMACQQCFLASHAIWSVYVAGHSGLIQPERYLWSSVEPNST